MNSLVSVPSSPHMSDWTFVEQFKIYQHETRRKCPQECPADKIDLSQGLILGKLPEDTDHLLDTAYADFTRLLTDLRIPHHCGHTINFKLDSGLPGETFVLTTGKSGSSVRIADIEAARRAVYFLMDEIASSEGTCLAVREWRREPFVRIRISRCYFGAKRRPPLFMHDLMKRPDYPEILANDPEYRDELLGDPDYYFPDAYLSRLARESVNGLWLVGYFSEICKSTIIPEYGEDAEKRLGILRKIVDKCRRYGIKTYLFCMEPSGFGWRIPVDILKAHPELAGNYAGSAHFFCTSTDKGKAYTEEACYYLFSQVPNLGGLINLCVGERPTNCCSGSIDDVENHCPRCSKRDPAEVVAETLAIMKRGMSRANPEAELIAWPYGQYILWGEEKTVEAVNHIPDDVILIHNFESRGHAKQLNKVRVLDDYWLAYPGPSQLFRDCAQAAIKNHTRFGAKIQTACSYELATVPFVPVPGILYKKYKAMRELQVHTVMQCWLIGSCPSVMTQAAGILSFGPFPKTEKEFLLKLAAIDWGESSKEVASAWKLFQKAYENYPYSRIFSYYSPMNAGVVWPLFLKPRDKELYPPFRANRPPCGDRIGECLKDDFTLEEAIILCRKMTFYWDKGLQTLNAVADRLSGNESRRKDIGVANAVGIQIRSAYNILTFYHLREEMAWNKSFERKKTAVEKAQENYLRRNPEH